jgi:molybdopterin converting factor small subunit
LIELYFLRRAQQRVFDELVQARKARDKRRGRPKENPETLQLLEAKVAALQELETSFPKEYPVRLRHLVGHGSEPTHEILYPCDEAKEAVRLPNAQEWSDFGQDMAGIARKMATLADEDPDLFSSDFQPPSISMFKVPQTLPLFDDMMQVDDDPPMSEKDSSSITTLRHDITHVHNTFSYINEVKVDEERPALEDLIDEFNAGLKEEENKWPNEGIDLENLRQQYPKWKEEADGRLNQLREMVHELEEQNKKHRRSNFALRLGVYKV